MPSLSIQSVAYWEPSNFWIGPRAVSSYAMYDICSRSEKLSYLNLTVVHLNQWYNYLLISLDGNSGALTSLTAILELTVLEEGYRCKSRHVIVDIS